jgi:hypothetical protein
MKQAFPLLPTKEEGRLTNARLRENFTSHPDELMLRNHA